MSWGLLVPGIRKKKCGRMLPRQFGDLRGKGWHDWKELECKWCSLEAFRRSEGRPPKVLSSHSADSCRGTGLSAMQDVRGPRPCPSYTRSVFASLPGRAGGQETPVFLPVFPGPDRQQMSCRIPHPPPSLPTDQRTGSFPSLSSLLRS